MKRLLLTALLAALPSAGAATLVYGASDDPVSLEPGNIIDITSISAQQQLYDRLVNFKPGTTDPVPGLATGWKSNKDATQWTFTLRQNVKFHDGTPFNADAVVYNFSRWWDPKAPQGFRDQGRTYEVWAQLLGGFKGNPDSVVKNIVKVNGSTVRFDLNKPMSVFPEVVGSGYFGIASPAAIQKEGAKYGTPASKPVGTGPFIFQGWRTGDRLTFAPNRQYWGNKPQVDGLILRTIKDPTQRLNELKAGTIDFASDLTPDSLRSIQADRNLVAVKRPSFNVGFLSLNNRNPYLKNDKVRQAVSLAINKKAIAEAFYNGLAISDASLLPPVLSWANSKNVPADYKFDPAAAKKLLADAGYPNGFSLDLWYMPVSRPYFPNPKPIAEAMAADLAAIGIKANLKTEDWAKYLEDRNKNPGFDMYIVGWIGDYGDPDNFYRVYGPTAEDINWNPPELQRLLEQGRTAVSRSDKARIYAQVHELTYKANFRIPMVHSQPLGAARSYVKGWVPSPLGSEAFNNISVADKK